MPKSGNHAVPELAAFEFTGDTAVVVYVSHMHPP